MSCLLTLVRLMVDLVFNVSYEEIYSLKGLVTKSAVSVGDTVNKCISVECGGNLLKLLLLLLFLL